MFGGPRPDDTGRWTGRRVPCDACRTSLSNIEYCDAAAGLLPYLRRRAGQREDKNSKPRKALTNAPKNRSESRRGHAAMDLRHGGRTRRTSTQLAPTDQDANGCTVRATTCLPAAHCPPLLKGVCFLWCILPPQRCGGVFGLGMPPKNAQSSGLMSPSAGWTPDLRLRLAFQQSAPGRFSEAYLQCVQVRHRYLKPADLMLAGQSANSGDRPSDRHPIVAYSECPDFDPEGRRRPSVPLERATATSSECTTGTRNGYILGGRPASGVRGDDGVYPARPSALYTLTGPLGRSMASVDLKQPSMHRRCHAVDNHRSVGSDVRATHVRLGRV
ncbi:hypothetical protein THAOC_13961 [Thalassiosira oceanica]|uniref:Uncharacterized protein n=1 Tax=Thalassiosira oceanica TaxID=159749 RepID=K0SGH7_THAOC|nr:hypothetical protein THAOC_13961 [Thalassiosira oceanica]|eukprot:EJK65208.1 hypothetical protein THAOC_13961 [Thalassiosira oceanica]